jgi:hypothetical protein
MVFKTQIQGALLGCTSSRLIFLFPFNLAENGWVLNFGIIRKHKSFAKNHRKRGIALKGEKDRFCGAFVMVGNDAEVLTIGFHQNIAAAQVDVVSAEGALHNQKFF